MPQAATIKSLPRAFRMMKTLQAQGIEWGEDYRRAGALALKDVLEGRMAAGVDRHLDEMAERGAADRRNGSYRRWLMTELGEIELSVPRTRSWSALAVVRAYARRAAHIDRMILACFVLGLSTRKVAIALLPILGRRISAGTVSQVAKTLDAAVAAFHRRPLKDIYPVLMLDGVVLARKTGMGALRRPVLVALGLRPDGKKEIIDYRLAVAESAREWELFLTDLFRRGLEGARLEMICVDGGAGLLAALPMVYPGVPIQRCWAHKIRNVLGKVKKADRKAAKAGLHAIMNAQTVLSAGSFLLIDFCLIFVPFGHYDEPEILRYAITSICPKGADVRQKPHFGTSRCRRVGAVHRIKTRHTGTTFPTSAFEGKADINHSPVESPLIATSRPAILPRRARLSGPSLSH